MVQKSSLSLGFICFLLPFVIGGVDIEARLQPIPPIIPASFSGRSIMLRQIFLAASLASIVFAAPTSTSSTLDPRNAYDFSPQLADFYSAVSQEISKVKSSPAYASGLSSCNMDNAAANFPSSPTTLPSPSTGSKLKHVLLGMGYQVCNRACCPSPPMLMSAVELYLPKRCELNRNSYSDRSICTSLQRLLHRSQLP